MSIPSGTIDILRGISNNYVEEPEQKRSWEYDTSVWSAANEKSKEEDNKTAITVLLEDFAELSNSLNENGASCINRSDTKKYGFFEKLFKECDNVFKTDAGRQTLRENGSFTQRDIYKQEMTKNGGLVYADENDNIKEAALNFAKADINAIESAYYMAYPKANGKDGTLAENEINSYFKEIIPDTVYTSLYKMNIDGKNSISAEEYASYLIAVDGMTGNGFSMESVDGQVSIDEADLVNNMQIEDIQKAAKEVYNNFFAK